MKKNYMYYVVDPIAETIIGSFSAISDDMAKKIIEKALNEEKLKVYRDYAEVYKGDGLFEFCETFGEVVSCCNLFGAAIRHSDDKPVDEVK